jgi:uncharacterized protein YcbK (DUF882 family)
VLARRNLLKLGLSAAAGAGLAAAPALSWAETIIPTAPIPALTPANPAPVADTMRSVAMNNLHTGESIEAVYWDEGAYLVDALDAVNSHLRDFRTGDIYPIDPRVLDLMDAVSNLTGSKAPFQVISGYRSPKTNAMLHERSAEVAKKSLHTMGMAIDVRLPDVELHHLHAAAMSLGRGGVGFYPSSNFVHLDVGPVRSWYGS